MTDLVRLIDLPGVARIETALRDPGRAMVKEYDDLPKWIEETSSRLFGITLADTEFTFTEADCEPKILTNGYDVLKREASRRRDEWEANFAFLEEEFIDDEEAGFWALIGLDVLDDEGDHLHVMEHFGRQLVCIIKRLHSRARLSLTGDDPQVVATGKDATADAERWGQSLAEAARRFKPPR